MISNPASRRASHNKIPVGRGVRATEAAAAKSRNSTVERSEQLAGDQADTMAAIAESAMMSAGRGGGMDAGAARAARARAYEDLVAGGVLACSDYGRKNSLVQWALRCKSML